MTGRRFGVEIECAIGFCEAGDRDKVVTALSEAARIRKIANQWTMPHGDGSFLEFTGGPMSGKEGLTELELVMNILKENDGYVTQSDGLHVHHDAPEFVRNPDAIVKLVKCWMNIQPWVNQIVHQRRTRSAACPQWDVATVEYAIAEYDAATTDVAKTRAVSGLGGRRNMNLSALSEHGTVEFRMLEGTLDFDRVAAWIGFGQSFMDRVVELKREMKPIDSVSGLYTRFGISRKAIEALSRPTSPGERKRRPVPPQPDCDCYDCQEQRRRIADRRRQQSTAVAA